MYNDVLYTCQVWYAACNCMSTATCSTQLKQNLTTCVTCNWKS
jgi:hypothetical protein